MNNTIIIGISIALVIIAVILTFYMRSRSVKGIVISDTSAIGHLTLTGYLDLLQDLFDTIWITPEIYQELCAVPATYRVIQKTSWIKVKRVRNQQRVISLLQQYQNQRPKLDRGEASAIVLAIETQARLLVIDEALGRRVAQANGIPITGAIGILLQAKDKGLIPDIKTPMDALIASGFRISVDLRQRTLRQVGEQP